MEELRVRFGQFVETDRRPDLHRRLEEFMADVRAADIADAVIIDGSFVTSKAAPGDIDLVLLLREDVIVGEDVLRPDQLNVVSPRRVKQRFGFDLMVAKPFEDSVGPLVEFFARVRGEPTALKGMLKVTP